MDKDTQVAFKIFSDEAVDKEVKLMIILNLLHDEKISLKKAYEMCEEIGLFSNSWIIVDAKFVEFWEKCYKKESHTF